MRTKQITRQPPRRLTEKELADLVEEYDWLRSFGRVHERVAADLDIPLDRLDHYLKRAGRGWTGRLE